MDSLFKDLFLKTIQQFFFFPVISVSGLFFQVFLGITQNGKTNRHFHLNILFFKIAKQQIVVRSEYIFHSVIPFVNKRNRTQKAPSLKVI